MYPAVPAQATSCWPSLGRLTSSTAHDTCPQTPLDERYGGFACAHYADFYSVQKFAFSEFLDDALFCGRCARDEQPPARLRIADELALPVRRTRRHAHFVAVAFPVAVGCAGRRALL